MNKGLIRKILYAAGGILFGIILGSLIVILGVHYGFDIFFLNIDVLVSFTVLISIVLIILLYLLVARFLMHKEIPSEWFTRTLNAIIFLIMALCSYFITFIVTILFILFTSNMTYGVPIHRPDKGVGEEKATISQKEDMGRKVSSRYRNLIPNINTDIKFRENGEVVTLFDPGTLKTAMMDRYAAETLRLIDNKSNISAIARGLGMKCNMHPLMAEFRTVQYLSNFQRAGIVSMPVPLNVFPRARIKKPSDFPAPVLVSWEVTKVCNLDCSHCASQKMEGSELDTREAIALIEHLHKLGIFVISFSGGEPFIRSDIFLLLERARELGIEVGLTTNGTLLDEGMVKKLTNLEPFNVHISIDGIGRVHDSFRNRYGVFDMAVNSLELFRKYGVPHGITTSVTKRNFHDVDNIKEFVKANDIRSWEIFYAIPVGNLKKNEALEADQFMELARKIESIRLELNRTRIFVGDSLGYFGMSCIRDEEWSGCTAGINHCAIDAYGNVKGCPVQPPDLIEGNIRDRSLGEIWSLDSAFPYNRKNTRLEGYCSKCGHRRECGAGCKTSAFQITGTLTENRMCLHYLENLNKKVKA